MRCAPEMGMHEDRLPAGTRLSQGADLGRLGRDFSDLFDFYAYVCGLMQPLVVHGLSRRV